MIDNYNPKAFNNHKVRVTFNKRGFTGHIVYNLGGNCRGLDVLNSTEDFIDECCEGDISALVKNDCNLSIDEDAELFEITLVKGNQKETLILEEKDLKKLVTGVEIVDCTESYD